MNITDYLRSRGIENASRYLVTKGLPYHMVNRLLMNKVRSVNYDMLERVCTVCNCTPDEILVWKPDANAPLPEDHPLQKLKPKPVVKNPVERVKELSPAKLAKLQAFMDELEKG